MPKREVALNRAGINVIINILTSLRNDFKNPDGMKGASLARYQQVMSDPKEKAIDTAIRPLLIQTLDYVIADLKDKQVLLRQEFDDMFLNRSNQVGKEYEEQASAATQFRDHFVTADEEGRLPGLSGFQDRFISGIKAVSVMALRVYDAQKEETQRRRR